MDIEELWAIQEGQGIDARGHDLTIVVPATDPEFGPYTGHAFVEASGAVPPGYRMLTQEEVLTVLSSADYEREA